MCVKFLSLKGFYFMYVFIYVIWFEIGFFNLWVWLDWVGWVLFI